MRGQIGSFEFLYRKLELDPAYPGGGADGVDARVVASPRGEARLGKVRAVFRGGGSAVQGNCKESITSNCRVAHFLDP